MNRSRHLILPVLALCLVACSKEESRETGGLVMHTITAGIEGATKVQINPEADTKVLWTANEKVDVWVGETAYPFESQNASAAASTKFEGTAPAELGTWVLVAPEGASTGKSGDNITATLPAVQTAVAGGFDPAAAIVAGRGTGSTVICKHLYSGIRFKLTETGIKTVSLRGNNGEKIAGTFSFDISDGRPVISGGSSEIIVLNAPSGGSFATGTWYYILCLPTEFSKGVTITADKENEGNFVGYVTTEGPAEFVRTKLKSRELTFGDWKTIGTTGTVYYGPANTICLKPNECATIDVAPYLTTAKWQRSGIPAEAVLPGSVEILWGGPFASLGISDGKTITIKAGESEGSSLIAIKNGESILWSYLIWVKSSFSETTLNGKILLPPLGDNCYFQWGRKDPLLSGASRISNSSSNSLDYSIMHPIEFIKGVSSDWDWFYTGSSSGQDATLWGGDSGRKTVWDPCPQGYRVPSEADYTSIIFEDITKEKGFLQLGFYGRDIIHTALSSSASYWTRTVSGFDSSALDDNESGHSSSVFDGFHRDYALPIRCVKE